MATPAVTGVVPHPIEIGEPVLVALQVTVPPTVPLPVMLAVNVTEPPKVEGFVPEVTATVVADWLTVWVNEGAEAGV